MKITKNSEFLYLLGFFLFFTISTYGSLIPNNRVITDDPEDYDLIEGITYNIVHFMSENNLVSSDDHVTVAPSDDNNPYQHWSLQKVKDNIYNIVNIGSGTNLDNNGKGVYVSSPEQNSITNQYQQWIFIKIKNNTYNVANMRDSKSQSLGSVDSDGKTVYIRPSDRTNQYQQWSFEPANYKLTMVVTDLNYSPEGRNESKITLFDDNSKIENPTGASIEHTVERTEKKSHSFTLEIRKSESFEVGEHIDMSFTISANIFDILGLKKETNEGIEGKFKETTEERNKETVKVEVGYHINQKVMVPAFTSVKVFANADKIDLVTPFNAKILITCKADRLSKNGKVIIMTDVDASAVKYYLQNKSDKETFMDGNSYYMNTSGTLTVDGYGIITNIKTEPLDNSPMNSESSPKNLVILYQVILTFLQIIIFLQN